MERERERDIQGEKKTLWAITRVAVNQASHLPSLFFNKMLYSEDGGQSWQRKTQAKKISRNYKK